MNVTLIHAPGEAERMLFKRAIWVTMGRTDVPATLPSPGLVRRVLRARHSPCRVLNFAFLIEGIPGNISVHLCRHVHAVPFVQSLRNDRQDAIDGDSAPRNTPVNMILYVNAEELMVIANKRLCQKASAMTQRVVAEMCARAEEAMPELEGLLVPMCEYCGGVCHEITPCGGCGK